MKYHFIVNPVAGGGRCKERFVRLCDIMNKAKIKYSYEETKGQGDAELLVRKAITLGFDAICAVGGDGTIHEVARALVNTKIPMVIIPFGTGNDFAYYLKLPSEPEAVLQMLLHGSKKSIDAGSVNGIPFINAAGFGFDVEVLLKTEKFKQKNIKSSTAYYLGAITAILKLKSVKLEYISNDGKKISLDSMIVVVGNGRYIGGGMKATPLADASDGLLDVCVIKKTNRLNVLRLLTKFMKGRHLEISLCTYFTTREIRFDFSPDVRIELDGEILEKGPATFRVIPRAIDIILPENSNL